ncbi:MAG: nuclear transport factor 2 family protein [Gemmatimonadota bacterium]|nr:nuclear transport factor 2 family protein [Gemmatimonadota bacterium]
MTVISPALAILILGGLANPPSPEAPSRANRAPDPDSAAVASVATAFHAALAAGDTAAILRLLAPDAVILESGDLESRTEYAAHHLPADIEFARSVPGDRVVSGIRVEGSVAWVTAMSTNRGEFRGRAVASQGAELMILSREGGTWRIRAIHWSSRRL